MNFSTGVCSSLRYPIFFLIKNLSLHCHISFRFKVVSIIKPVTYAFRWLRSYYCTWCRMNIIQKNYAALGLLRALCFLQHTTMLYKLICIPYIKCIAFFILTVQQFLSYLFSVILTMHVNNQATVMLKAEAADCRCHARMSWTTSGRRSRPYVSARFESQGT
jgi:hypothetical protein